MGYWDNITDIYKKQRDKGIKEYGQTLEENKKLTSVERKRMTQEELIDAALYLEHDIQVEQDTDIIKSGQLRIHGLAYEDIMAILMRNGYSVQVTASGTNPCEAEYIIDYILR